jgi:hypothetical protein
MRWITRERARVDRIACPWLISRFIDPQPEFLFVPANQVLEHGAPVPDRRPSPSGLPRGGRRGRRSERSRVPIGFRERPKSTGSVEPRVLKIDKIDDI